MDWLAQPGRRIRSRLAVRAMLAVLTTCVTLTFAGCSSWQLPRIDPSGDRLFLPEPATTTPVNPWRNWGCFPRPAFTTPATPPPCPPAFAPPSPAPAATTPACPPVAGPPACPPGGAAASPQPMPRSVFPTTAPGIGPTATLTLTPARVVQPVGAEVILMCGLRDTGGVIRGSQPVEWMLAGQSVGAIVQVGEEGLPCWRRWMGSAPRKISSNYALGRTGTMARVVTRGTPSQTDDFWVGPGQTWASISSAVEGTSHVTVLAPKVAAWDQRQQSATIHWIDAQWVLPPPVVGRAGAQHVLTTTLRRATSTGPIAGWIVRYEIADGPAAGFAPSGAKVIEVRTDAQGRAAATIVPQGAGGGVSRVRIQIIRLGVSNGDPPRMGVGEGWTSVTWSAPALSIRTTGPEIIEVGRTATYRVEVSNAGDLPAKDVVVNDRIPAELSYVGSTPSGQIFGDRVEWRLGDLPARSVRTIEIQCRAEQDRQVRHCVTARSAGGLKAEGCATSRVFRSALTVAMTGPKESQVGQAVQFQVTVTNRGAERLAGVLLSDRFDGGLRHAESASPLQRSLGDFAPGQSKQFALTFTVAQAGKHCQEVRITAPGGHWANTQACLTATQPQPQGKPAMTVRKTGPTRARVGDEIDFFVKVTNTGDVPLTNVEIGDQTVEGLNPLVASPGNDRKPDPDRLVWTVARLDTGQTVAKQIRVKCTKAVRSACTRVTVTAAEGLTMADEVCVEILPAPQVPPSHPPPNGGTGNGGTGNGGTGNGAETKDPPVGDLPQDGRLVLSIAENRNPVPVGQRVTYIISIKNDRKVSDKAVYLTLTLPQGMRFEQLTGQLPKWSKSRDGRMISVSAIREIRPGETIIGRLEMTAVRPSQAQLTAQVKSMRQNEPVIVERKTTVSAE